MTSDSPTELPSSEIIGRRLAEVRERIDAARSTGQQVTVVAVTKTFPPLLVERAGQAGLVHLGENYAQELLAKAQDVADRDPSMAQELTWHFIGGLQRNKIKMLGPLVGLWQTIDRRSLVTELAKRCPGASMLVQVNTTAEGQKSGCPPTETGSLIDLGRELGLEVAGLMTIGPTDGSDPRPAFDLLRRLADDHEVSELSMGMSGDYEAAVGHGATMVRIGSALFGPRHTMRPAGGPGN